jgi:AraC family transcriptional regulator
MPNGFCEIITSFPDFNRNGFNMEDYNRKFVLSNVVIHDETRSVHYPEHWGPLSLKCAFNGNEYFRVNGGEIAINNKKYLILNEGNYYSSCIDSETKVESFSINFSPSLINEMASGLLETDDFNICNSGYERKQAVFGEQRYVFDDEMTCMINELRKIIFDESPYKNAIEYLYRQILEHLFKQQKQLNKNIRSVPKIRLSTQRELYKRLTRAKDYIDSCYDRDLSLEELARVCYLNSSYFLRQFKNYYKVTPRQYLIGKRMQAAKEQLESGKRLPITDICSMVGYSDLSSFGKLFKQYYSCSPERYRRLHNHD